MNSITLSVPELLFERLKALAHSEGVSLNDYVLAALARQAAPAYRVAVVPEEQRERNQQEFAALLQRLGTATEEEIERALDEGEPGTWEPGLTPEVVAKFQTLLEEKKSSPRAG